MGDAPEVLVIGAGIIGCAVARELARRGAGVRVVEARTVGSGATFASAGVLAPLIEAPSAGVLLELTSKSLAMYDRFVADVATDAGIAVEYRRTGTIEIAADETAEAAFTLRAAAHRSHDAALGWLSSGELRALEPALAESICGGILAPSHGYVAAPALAEALIWSAMRHGAELETHRRITRIESDGDRVAIASEDGGRWTASHVVLAAGSWAAHCGLVEPAASAVTPIRGQLVRLAWRALPLRHVLWGPRCYVVPWRDGTVLVGATVEDVGFDERTTAAGVRDLLDAVCELLPEAWGATFVEARAGLRPATTDELPVIGESPTLPRVIFATGHYRNGVLLAPWTAAAVADLILDARRDPLLAALSPRRFRICNL